MEVNLFVLDTPSYDIHKLSYRMLYLLSPLVAFDPWLCKEDKMTSHGGSRYGGMAVIPPSMPKLDNRYSILLDQLSHLVAFDPWLYKEDKGISYGGPQYGEMAATPRPMRKLDNRKSIMAKTITHIASKRT